MRHKHKKIQSNHYAKKRKAPYNDRIPLKNTKQKELLTNSEEPPTKEIP
jgi:hypothetical protein